MTNVTSLMQEILRIRSATDELFVTQMAFANLK